MTKSEAVRKGGLTNKGKQQASQSNLSNQSSKIQKHSQGKSSQQRSADKSSNK